MRVGVDVATVVAARVRAAVARGTAAGVKVRAVAVMATAG